MAITFDGASKRIVLDSASATAADIWSRWADWHEANPQWPLAFRQSGGDPVGGGIYSPTYFFLQNGWRVRPMESDHDLAIAGNLAVEGGGTPVVRTLGAYQVNTAYVVPERAQGIATGSGLTTEQATQLAELHKHFGLKPGAPLTITPTSRVAEDVELAIAEAGSTVTVTRQ